MSELVNGLQETCRGSCGGGTRSFEEQSRADEKDDFLIKSLFSFFK